MTGMLRTRRIPGVPAGTRIWLARACGAACGSVTAMTIVKSAPSAEEANHLRPSITQSSPSAAAVVLSTTGFDPACCGSVMAKQLRAAPAASGRRKVSRCAGVPWPSSSSMLPMSGAWQFSA